jgi:GTP-binding protein
MQFCVNDGPFAGREGKRVTSREIRDRLLREARTNISLQRRGYRQRRRLHRQRPRRHAGRRLVEQMRREGFEVLVSRPVVIEKTIDGRRCEPFETLYVEVPDEASGGVMSNLAGRRAIVEAITPHNGRTTIEATVPPAASSASSSSCST